MNVYGSYMSNEGLDDVWIVRGLCKGHTECTWAHKCCINSEKSVCIHIQYTYYHGLCLIAWMYIDYILITVKSLGIWKAVGPLILWWGITQVGGSPRPPTEANHLQEAWFLCRMTCLDGPWPIWSGLASSPSPNETQHNSCQKAFPFWRSPDVLSSAASSRLKRQVLTTSTGHRSPVKMVRPNHFQQPCLLPSSYIDMQLLFRASAFQDKAARRCNVNRPVQLTGSARLGTSPYGGIRPGGWQENFDPGLERLIHCKWQQ